MRRCLPALLLFLGSLGCTSTWQAVYAGASTTADFVTEAHRFAWSEPLRERVDECDASLPDERTTADVDECLGPFVHNAEVLDALERYNAAAAVLSATLLATDPNGDPEALLSAWANVVAAARELIALFPEGVRLSRQLDALTKVAR